MEHQTTERTDWSGKTILIAEDEHFNYLFLEKALLKTNINVLRASNGFEAIEKCKDYPDIDIVLMDIKMPEMNGLEATRKIKEFRPELIIIAQTAYAMANDRNECLEAGCDDYLAKPIRKKELMKILSKFM